MQISESLTYEIHVVLKLFPNISIELEPIRTVNTNLTAELTVFSPSARRDAPLFSGARILKAPEGLFPHSVNIHTSAPLLGSEDALVSKKPSL